MKILRTVGSALVKAAQWALYDENDAKVGTRTQMPLPPGRTVEKLNGYELMGAVQLGYVRFEDLSQKQKDLFNRAHQSAANIAQAPKKSD